MDMDALGQICLYDATILALQYYKKVWEHSRVVDIFNSNLFKKLEQSQIKIVANRVSLNATPPPVFPVTPFIKYINVAIIALLY